NKEFSSLNTAKAFENFHNDDFVRRAEIGVRVKRIHCPRLNTHGGEQIASLLFEVCWRLVPEHLTHLTNRAGCTDRISGRSSDKAHAHIGRGLADSACRGNTLQLIGKRREARVRINTEIEGPLAPRGGTPRDRGNNSVAMRVCRVHPRLRSAEDVTEHATRMP